METNELKEGDIVYLVKPIYIEGLDDTVPNKFYKVGRHWLSRKEGDPYYYIDVELGRIYIALCDLITGNSLGFAIDIDMLVKLDDKNNKALRILYGAE